MADAMASYDRGWEKVLGFYVGAANS
jgi:hypothetical protein